ncbi:hypothetical protein D3C81_169920 [compost metagenome]
MSAQINTQAVAKAATALEAAYAELQKARNDYATVKALNGQVGYKVTVNGISVDVAVMDQRTYMAAMIRGREMIHLGALKALQARITQYETYVAQCESHLLVVANKGGAA